MKIFVIEYIGGQGKVHIAKRTEGEAIKWFKENYPHRAITDIYEQ